MIIKSFRTPTAYGHARFRNHVFRGDENEGITLIKGVERDVEDFFEDAQREHRRYAVRHFIISPEVETTADEMMEIVLDLGAEFGFDPAMAVIIEHQKPRAAENVFNRHWHVLASDGDSDGTIQTSHSFARQEKISRLAEWKFGHPFVKGAHHAAVLVALEREGRYEVSTALRMAFPEAGPPPQAAFTSSEAQKAKRTGADLSVTRELVRTIWASTKTAAELKARLAEHGLTVTVGTRRNAAWFVADNDGDPLLRLAGAAHVTRAEVLGRMGDPANVTRAAGRPDEEADRGDQPAHDEHSSVTKPRGRDGGTHDCPVARNRRAAAEFVERIKGYASNIESLLAAATVMATPPAVEFEHAIGAAQMRAERVIASAEKFSLEESEDLRVARRTLAEAEALCKKCAAALERADAKLTDAQAWPRPFFGRALHDRQVLAVQSWHARVAERLKAALDQKTRAAKDVVTLLDFHRSDEKQARRDLEAGVPSAREELKVVAIARKLVTKNPLMIRWGAWAIYSMAWAQYRRETALTPERETRLWNGETDIWGKPIEPPQGFRP